MRNTERPVTDDPVLGRILTTMEKKGVNQQDVTRHLGYEMEIQQWKIIFTISDQNCRLPGCLKRLSFIRKRRDC